MSDGKMFDPMKGMISEGNRVPTGTYNGKFVKAEYLPKTEADPMTDKGKRDYESIRFVWEITEGDHIGKAVNTETTMATGIKSRFYQVVCWLLGKNSGPGEAYDLTSCIGKKYLLTLGNKPGNKPGKSPWVEVVNAMMLPGQ